MIKIPKNILNLLRSAKSVDLLVFEKTMSKKEKAEFDQVKKQVGTHRSDQEYNEKPQAGNEDWLEP